ncbi:GtrA family protein [Parvularcula flava]|uniref:GtrA family protein n=1 Tax=Aquisalinus luteolus TaxID=1566827 RepID=A0A8J3AB13_9PROT|nr:GtrA family protein [Aquisalinus luteolus]NHK29538.1 GtrA family protein [Aquisalinus luteolus]GGI01637.1 sugar translocase [Aquisalinus luteolus]
MTHRFIRFALVGTAGFLVDASVLSAVTWLGAGPYVGRLISFAVAVTVTWYLNRVFTFGDHDPLWLRQWARFVSVNAVGGLINYGVYALLVAFIPFFATHLVAAVAMGSIAGLAWNFIGSSKVVFRGQPR